MLTNDVQIQAAELLSDAKEDIRDVIASLNDLEEASRYTLDFGIDISKLTRVFSSIDTVLDYLPRVEEE